MPSATYRVVLGATVYRLRKERKISQQQVAAAVGLTQASWSRIERGRSPMTVEQLVVVAAQLQMRSRDLLDLVDCAVAELGPFTTTRESTNA